MAQREYSIPRPRPQATLILLSLILVIGIAALFLAAFAAFGQIMPWYQALFAALLIEASMVVEALAFVRGRNLLAACGLVVSLFVSGAYNYTQATVAAKDGLPPVLLLALALGPLSSLAFLAMATGKELSLYEANVEKWQTKRQGWLDRQASKSDARETERKAEPVPGNGTGNGTGENNQTRRSAEEILSGNPSLTGAELAKMLGISDSMGRRYKRAITGKSESDRTNGNHHDEPLAG